MTEEQNKKIVQYYGKGLNAKEIAKLMDLNARTVQRYIKAGLKSITKEPPRPLRRKVLEYIDAGFSYSEAARRFKICKTTVYKWRKKAKQEAEQ